MFCPKCGEQVNLQANFCRKCGNSIKLQGNSKEIQSSLENTASLGIKDIPGFPFQNLDELIKAKDSGLVTVGAAMDLARRWTTEGLTAPGYVRKFQMVLAWLYLVLPLLLIIYSLITWQFLLLIYLLPLALSLFILRPIALRGMALLKVFVWVGYLLLVLFLFDITGRWSGFLALSIIVPWLLNKFIYSYATHTTINEALKSEERFYELFKYNVIALQDPSTKEMLWGHDFFGTSTNPKVENQTIKNPPRDGPNTSYMQTEKSGRKFIHLGMTSDKELWEMLLSSADDSDTRETMLFIKKHFFDVDKIKPVKYFANYHILKYGSRQASSERAAEANELDMSQYGTESIDWLISSSYQSLPYDEWFMAAYPDVVKWAAQLIKQSENSFRKLLGDPSESELFDAENKLNFPYLRKMISAYKQNGRLETSISHRS